MDDRHLTLIQCNVNEAELDLRLIISRESHLDQSHARYLGQSYTEGPSHFPLCMSVYTHDTHPAPG